MKRQSEKGKIRKDIDKLVKIYLMKTRPHVCQWCKKPAQNLHAAHILSKGHYPKLRFCEKNLLLLCYYCHMHRWHKEPIEAYNFMVGLRGETFRERLLLINATEPKHNLTYLKTLKKAYEKILSK